MLGHGFGRKAERIIISGCDSERGTKVWLTRRISYRHSSCTSGPSNASLIIGDANLFMSYERS
jgi:hypothetical protein